MAVNSNRPAPAYEAEVLMISRMRAMLSQAFPVLLNRDKWSNPWGVSGPQSNPSRGGHYGSRKGNLLIKAKAADIYLNASKPYEKKLGDLLFTEFVEKRHKLGIDFVVWDRQKSTDEGDARDYPKLPKTCPGAPVWKRESCLHRDHLHVEFKANEGDRDNSAILAQIIGKIELALNE